ncbi:hypothetical protein F4808DRAFT_456217 [Astrocystis sublimbata]|nr:hypothetical protein F4808DRAFT_456217 [Astrocystis sublimbata]
MRASLIISLLPAIGAWAAALPQQETKIPTATSSSSAPCPTAPTNCASKLDGHLVCLNSRTWCLYTDTARHTPAFFPVDLNSRLNESGALMNLRRNTGMHQNSGKADSATQLNEGD